jgi:hypothetical protein
MKFIPVDPRDMIDFRETHRGRVSYPILKGFLETGIFLAKVDRTGIPRTASSLYSSLSAYARSHEIPVKCLLRKNDIFLMRLDVDAEGNPIEDWLERLNDDSEPEFRINPREIEHRYQG